MLTAPHESDHYGRRNEEAGHGQRPQDRYGARPLKLSYFLFVRRDALKGSQGEFFF